MLRIDNRSTVLAVELSRVANGVMALLKLKLTRLELAKLKCTPKVLVATEARVMTERTWAEYALRRMALRAGLVSVPAILLPYGDKKLQRVQPLGPPVPLTPVTADVSTEKLTDAEYAERMKEARAAN